MRRGPKPSPDPRAETLPRAAPLPTAWARWGAGPAGGPARLTVGLSWQENVSLADILSLRDRGLSEQEAWAVCRECSLAMQSVAHAAIFQSLCITPDTLAFNTSGNVCFMEQLSGEDAPSGCTGGSAARPERTRSCPGRVSAETFSSSGGTQAGEGPGPWGCLLRQGVTPTLRRRGGSAALTAPLCLLLTADRASSVPRARLLRVDTGWAAGSRAWPLPGSWLSLVCLQRPSWESSRTLPSRRCSEAPFPVTAKERISPSRGLKCLGTPGLRGGDLGPLPSRPVGSVPRCDQKPLSLLSKMTLRVPLFPRSSMSLETPLR
ncbi:Kinase non-catalytic C-lobe domain-containing protein 1 [Plecturocebus cupreus]